MNNKIIIKVYVPNLDTSYDVFISINLSIYDTTKLIIDSVDELSDVSVDNSARLYYRDNGQIIENDKTVKDSRLRNGSEVVLV